MTRVATLVVTLVGPWGCLGNRQGYFGVGAHMRIEIWSDVVCPWCYIGKRRLETALAGFEHRDEVEVVWRSFELDPGAPSVADESIAEHLGRKYGGGPEAGQRMIDQMEAVAAEEGLVYRLGRGAPGRHRRRAPGAARGPRPRPARRAEGGAAGGVHGRGGATWPTTTC